MLVPGVLFALFLAGAACLFWLIARLQARAAHRPPPAVDHLAHPALGDANVSWYPHHLMTSAPGAAVGRHPAGRSRIAGRQVPKGPDDDPEFLRQLARRIHGDLSE